MFAMTTEMNSFLSKFTQLNSYGCNANLNFNCFGGRIYVSLQTELGYDLSGGYSCNVTRKRSPKPSRVRRRLRRKQNTRNASNATASFSTEDDAANQMNVIEEETHVVETVHKTREDESCPLDVVSTADNVPISSSPSIAQKTLHQDALSEWKNTN